MFKITEGQYALGGLTVLAVWLFVILPLLHYFGDGWVTITSTIVTATAGGIVATFTIVLANVGKRAIPQFVIDGKWVQPYRPGRGFLHDEMSELFGVSHPPSS